MNTRFKKLISTLEPKFRELIHMPAVKYGSLPGRMPTQGVYLFSNGSRHLYVGRTDRLRQRLQEHCRPSSTHNSAPFAFRIARRMTGTGKALYTQAGSREVLARNPKFAAAFKAAKKRVAGMDIRFVAEGNPTRQALLEVYAATALRATYNDFNNH